MAEHETAEVDEEPQADASAEQSDTAADEAAPDDSGVADAVDDRAAELTGAGGAGGGGGDDEPISEINRSEVNAAAAHLDDANLASDRETLKKIQKGM